MKVAVLGKPYTIFGYQGKQVRDNIHSEDVLTAFYHFYQSPRAGEVYNLGSLERISLGDLADLMIKIHGKGSYQIIPFPEDRKPIDIGDYYGDYRKIKQALHWDPKINLEEGLARTLRYYREHIQNYL